MNEKVRTYLIELARIKDKTTYYGQMLNDCGIIIDLDSPEGQLELKELLSEITKFEHKHKRPMLTSIAINKKTNDPGPGFYKLADDFGYGNHKKLQNDLWGLKEADRTRAFWQDEDNYKKFASLNNEIAKQNKVEFFNQEELDFFKQWQYKVYNPQDPEHNEAGSILSKTVWQKSIYLGNEIVKRLQGFELDGQRRWTQRGWRQNENGVRIQAAIFKPYTWVKIYRNTDRGKDIFFTFGVDAYPETEAFIYKIDCQDKRDSKLTQTQIDLCKSLIPTSAKWNEIAFDDLIEENWESLISTCVAFIKTHTEQYDAIINAVWGGPISPPLFKNKLIKKDKPKNGFESIPESKKEFNGVDVDFHGKAKEQKDLGDKGETLVKQREIEFLTQKGMHDEAAKVDIVKDGKGYDVFSFDENGNEKFIEVKTTNGNEYAPFFLSENEIDFLRLHRNQYCIYRIYNFDEENNFAEFYELNGDIERQLLMKPIQFKVLIKKET